MDIVLRDKNKADHVFALLKYTLWASLHHPIAQRHSNFRQEIPSCLSLSNFLFFLDFLRFVLPFSFSPFRRNPAVSRIDQPSAAQYRNSTCPSCRVGRLGLSMLPCCRRLVCPVRVFYLRAAWYQYVGCPFCLLLPFLLSLHSSPDAMLCRSCATTGSIARRDWGSLVDL